jgi:rhodanese-related sulfurtransferase
MKTIDCQTVEKLTINKDELVFIDIRSPDEFAREHIPNSINIPLSQLSEEAVAELKNKKLLFYCRSGNRTKQAESKISQLPCAEVFCLQGGIDHWKKNGNSTQQDKKAPLELMRQVQIIAGLLILIGVILALTISSYFIIIPAFVGAGLLFAGISGFCGMANLLMLLPYNKTKQ